MFWSELPTLAVGCVYIMIPLQGPTVHLSWLHFGVSGEGGVDVWRPVGGHWYLQGLVKDRYIYRQTPALRVTSDPRGQRQCLVWACRTRPDVTDRLFRVLGTVLPKLACHIQRPRLWFRFFVFKVWNYIHSQGSSELTDYIRWNFLKATKLKTWQSVTFTNLYLKTNKQTNWRNKQIWILL